MYDFDLYRVYDRTPPIAFHQPERSVQCVDCPTTFVTAARVAMRCPACRQLARERVTRAPS